MTATRGRWSAVALCIIAMLPLAACGKDPVAPPNGTSAAGPAELKPTTLVAPDRLDAVLPSPGATKPYQFVRFLTPAPASGAYVLVLTAANSRATAEIPIQIQTAP